MAEMPNLTPDQKHRADLLYDLKIAVGRMASEIDTPYRFGGVLWFHFTDWNDQFDLPALVREGLLRKDTSIQYQKHNDWQDYFPPDAYRITAIGKAVLNDPATWVYRGLWLKDTQ